MRSLRILALICFVSSCASVKHKAQEPFTESYGINDQGNPDCGCRNWQKQADKEFQKLQQQELKLKSGIVKSRSFTRRRKYSPGKTKNVKHKRIHLRLDKAVDCFKWH